ncbi:transposase [Dictyobacter arantiisoli]|uniref:transposase n=1 Tax=Dictyobacter arantiisoli TaxID=2014874 RepID=UPI0011ED0EB8|nr:transposase [Dictyobacter arantiisoli]
MPTQYDILQKNEQDPQKTSQEIARELEVFLSPLLMVLDAFLDKRLQRTLMQCCVAILRFRNSKQGLLLSELGSYMDNYRGLSKSATAGTKRISNLIRSLKWNVSHIDSYLLEEAEREVKRLQEKRKRILCIWDGSVIEKPESSVAEGLCPVRSSKAKRLNRSRRGHVFNMPAARPVMVTGMHWTGALIAGLEGIPKVAFMSWWTTRGDYATKTREEEERLLRKCVRKWSDILVHIFDRGYASGPWLQFLQSLKVRFVIRWIKNHKFFDQNGEEKKLWEIGRGKKYLAHKEIFDTFTGQKMPCDVWWTTVWHASYAYPLYCVKVRVNKKIWYLITNEPIKTEVQAWEIVFMYKRRWQIETSFRYGKCELAMESPRLWAFENRLKLLSLVTICYAFLIHILEPFYRDMVQAVLHLKCHRTGKRCRETLAPLYRVRWAISRLWDDAHPVLGSILPPDLETIQVLASFRC